LNINIKVHIEFVLYYSYTISITFFTLTKINITKHNEEDKQN
jgi:hypothetical protein